MSPRRVQLSRAKGWRMPENTVSVARPTRWGNPFRIGDEGIHGPKSAVQAFALHVYGGRRAFFCSDVRRELKGKNLACWCALDQPCHADVLLSIANAPWGD